jgi:hypothetical protein
MKAQFVSQLEARGCDAASIGSLARSEEDAILLEIERSISRRRHVRALDHIAAAILRQLDGIVEIELVLRGARHCDVALLAPRTLSLMVDSGRTCLDILLDAAAADLLDIYEGIEVDAIRIVDIAVGVRDRDDLGTEALCLLDSVLSDIAGTRDSDRLALDGLALLLEHIEQEVDCTIACSLRTCKGAAIREALAGKDRLPAVRDLLVGAEHVVDLAAAGADVACRDICVRK